MNLPIFFHGIGFFAEFIPGHLHFLGGDGYWMGKVGIPLAHHDVPNVFELALLRPYPSD